MKAAEQMGLPFGERERRQTNREAVASLLADGAWHSGAELFKVGGFRYGARIHEIRHHPDRPREVDTRVEGGKSWFRLRPREQEDGPHVEPEGGDAA